jgi:heme oxygenase
VQPRLGSGVNDVVLVGQSGHGWLLGLGQGSARHWRAAGAALVRATSVVEEGREFTAGLPWAHLDIAATPG